MRQPGSERQVGLRGIKLLDGKDAVAALPGDGALA
jgi:hypothetical protein